MKLESSMLEALNQQVNRERQNSVPYAAMAARCDYMALRGLGKFFRKSSGEELEHAQRLIDYIIDRNNEVVMLPLQGADLPNTPDLSTLGQTLITAALALEEANTVKIKTLARMARDTDDDQTAVMLIWFIDEQTRSVAELIDMQQQWTFAAGCPSAVLQLDHELGED